MTDVRGRTAFITGGANGIGLGIARNLARAGAKIALADVDFDGLARAKAELEALGPVEVFELDVRDRDAYAAMADAAEDALGPVSLLFNNAGVATTAPAEKLSYALWDWVIGINFHGVVNGIQTFLPRIAERGLGGHIVNTASGAGLAATSSGVLYCASKFGVVGLSEALSAELKSTEIRVSVLCTGPVATGIVRRSADGAPAPQSTLSDEQKRRLAERKTMLTQVLGQSIGIDEVGAMVLRAVSDDNLYIHTDRMMEQAIEARTRALLDAMPSA